MGAAIRVRDLAKRYRLGRVRDTFPTLRDQLGTLFSREHRRRRENWFWALQDVNFEVAPGEVLGIIGHNGAGKSTLLKILARIVEPTRGRIELRGRVGCLLEVGTGFHPELTGRENIFLNASILGMSRQETQARFDKIVAFSGIEAFLDMPVKRYSSGMYLRLGFAVAAHIEPDILIVDEVLAVGDAAFQAKCLGKMGELVGEGRTVLIVSHQLPMVQRLCARAILIREGKVMADGPAQTVIAEHLRAMDERAEVPLGERPDRIGRGGARLHSISAEGEGGGPLVTGTPATFTFVAKGENGPLECSFTIYDLLGGGVASFDTANASRADCHAARAPRLFRCSIDALPLRPGRYRLNAAIAGADGLLEDHVEGALSFDVLPGLFAEREVDAATGYGSIAVAHRWEAQ